MVVQQVRQEMQMINKRAGIKLWKSFVPAIQMFTGYGTFMILRGMARLPVPGLEHGGVLWFHNLAVPDPFFILPLATAGILHWVLRVRLPFPLIFRTPTNKNPSAEARQAHQTSLPKQ